MPTSGSVCVTVDETSVWVTVTVVPNVHPVSMVMPVVVVVSTTVVVCF